MRKHLFKLITLIAGGLCIASATHLHGIAASYKGLGMADAVTAYPVDVTSAAFNPAAISATGDAITSGILWKQDLGTSRITGNPVPGVNAKRDAFKTKDQYSPEFGISKQWGCHWSFGLIVYNNAQAKCTYNQPLTLIGTSNPGIDYIQETIAPIAAYNFCWYGRHTFAATLNINLSRIKVNGFQKIETLSSNPGHVTNRGYDYSNGYGTTLGYRWDFNDCFALGFAWSPKCQMRRHTKYSGFFAQRGRIDVPQSFIGGLKYRPWNCLTLTFDVQRLCWNKMKILNNPLQPLLGRPLGTTDGPGFGWSGQTFYRVGAEWQINNCYAVRVGYRHANAPPRKEAAAINAFLLDIVQDYVTFGGTYSYSDRVDFSISYANGFYHKLKGPLPPELFGGSIAVRQNSHALALGFNYQYGCCNDGLGFSW